MSALTGPKEPPPPGAGPDPWGLAAALGAFGLWGVLPLYLLALEPASALEVLAHRVVWAVPAVAGGLWLAGWGKPGQGLAGLPTLLRTPKVLRSLVLSAALIGINWLVFIWAATNGRLMEASLAYFINPLVNVLLGVVFLGERLTRAQKIAVGLAGLGVVNQVVVVGAPPYVAAILVASFASYGFIRKTGTAPAGQGLLVETLLLTPIMLVLIAGLTYTGAAAAPGNPGLLALLVLAGPITAAPLFLFAVGARRLPLSSLGVIQFLAPSMQFAIGVATGEPFTAGHAVTFGLIWLAAGVFVWDMSRAAALRRAARMRPTPPR